MEKYKSSIVEEEKFLEQSSIIENAPYVLTKGHKPKLAGNSTGASNSSSHSSNSSSSSASRANGSLEDKI